MNILAKQHIIAAILTGEPDQTECGLTQGVHLVVVGQAEAPLAQKDQGDHKAHPEAACRGQN